MRACVRRVHAGQGLVQRGRLPTRCLLRARLEGRNPKDTASARPRSPISFSLCMALRNCAGALSQQRASRPAYRPLALEALSPTPPPVTPLELRPRARMQTSAQPASGRQSFGGCAPFDVPAGNDMLVGRIRIESSVAPWVCVSLRHSAQRVEGSRRVSHLLDFLRAQRAPMREILREAAFRE